MPCMTKRLKQLLSWKTCPRFHTVGCNLKALTRVALQLFIGPIIIPLKNKQYLVIYCLSMGTLDRLYLNIQALIGVGRYIVTCKEQTRETWVWMSQIASCSTVGSVS